MLSIMTFGFLTYIIAANLKSVAGKCATTILMGIVIVSIGLSRVILNVHYPTDILAGYCVGGILLIMAIYYHRLLTERLGLNKEIERTSGKTIIIVFQTLLYQDVIQYK